MVNGHSVIGVIIARGGSKGLPNKNLRRLGGKPLVAYTIQAAQAATVLDRVILSTDSSEIAGVGRRYGAEVPFIRPKSLARDTTHTPPVIEHAARYLERREGMRIDIVVTLQPTSPFRRPEHIDAAVKRLAADPKLDSVITVRRAVFPPFWMFTTQSGRLVPFVNDETDYSLRERQELPSIYQPNGAVYATRRRVLAERGVIFAAFGGGRTGFVEMDELASVDIDGAVDLMLAELLLRRYPELKGTIRGRRGARR